MNYSQKDIRPVFKRLCEVMGKRPATAYNDVGAWNLIHEKDYGGYVIEQIECAAGSISYPLGNTRMKPREFYYACHMVIAGVGVVKKQNENEVQTPD